MKTMGGLDLLDDVPQELPAELLAHMQHSTDPEADHSLRQVIHSQKADCIVFCSGSLHACLVKVHFCDLSLSSRAFGAIAWHLFSNGCPACAALARHCRFDPCPPILAR